MSDRVFQASENSFLYRMSDGLILRACLRCGNLQIAIKPYSALCSITQEPIAYPVSGPIGELCPLPEYHFPDEVHASE